MRKNLLLMLCIMAVVGCASIGTRSGTNAGRIMAAKSAYVVRHPKSSKDIDLYIQEALANRGMTVTVGPEEQIPLDVDMYIRYSDRWTWDMRMYMTTLSVSVYDRKTDAVIKSAEFRNSAFHLGSARNWTKNVINKLFEE